ncbi:MAG: putative ABC transporter permease [Lachnospiraceae bacterium]|nr:putative ABC transporter permease [Lachnospiraceae bacterium]
MWDLQIAGEDLYHIISWFWIYSFLGWAWESCYVSVKEKRLVNRGFVTGPVCTIYGCGAVVVYLLLKPISGNLILLYAGGVIVPTILEYLTSVLMERVFHTRWWDYSNKKYNFQGRICLGASLGWGAFSVVLFQVLHPFVALLVELYSAAIGKTVILAVTVIYGVDFVLSFAGAMQISKYLQRMEEAMEELYEYIQGTRLYGTAEELRDRMELYRLADYKDELKRRMEMRMDAVLAFGLEIPAEKLLQMKEKRVQVEERVLSLYEKYTQQKKEANFFARRILGAYPHIKTHAKALKDWGFRKKHKKETEIETDIK